MAFQWAEMRVIRRTCGVNQSNKQ